MNNKRTIQNLFFTALFILSSVVMNGQTGTLPGMGEFKTHIFRSDHNEKEYRLHVLLPASYSAADSARYPVLYVLDGEYTTLLFYSSIKVFSLAPELKDLIIVTIDGNTHSKTEWLASRYQDYTPSHNSMADTAIARFFKTPVVVSGGAPAFLATLETQIIPEIEKTYKTNGEKGLFGHSLGGLFGSYCLIHRPGLFQKYSVNSPSLWWSNGEMIPQMDSLASQNMKAGTSIFLSAGKSEGNFMISPIERFEKSLRNKFPGVRLTFKIFDDETHLSVVPVVIGRTLKEFYATTGRL